MGKDTRKTPVEKLKCQDGIPPAGQKEFKRIQPLLVAYGYTAIDEPVLTEYLWCVAICDEMRKLIDSQGMFVTTPTGQLQINPAHTVYKQRSELLKKYIQELGFSPGSRKRLGVDLKPELSDKDLLN